MLIVNCAVFAQSPVKSNGIADYTSMSFTSPGTTGSPFRWDRAAQILYRWDYTNSI